MGLCPLARQDRRYSLAIDSFFMSECVLQRRSRAETIARQGSCLLRYGRSLPTFDRLKSAHTPLMDERGANPMPTTPQPPREGHPGQPPRRDDDADAKRAPAGKPHSYGQSAPMPGEDEAPIEGETRAPARKIARVEEQHESVEDLAGEPMREEGEDEAEDSKP